MKSSSFPFPSNANVHIVKVDVEAGVQVTAPEATVFEDADVLSVPKQSAEVMRKAFAGRKFLPLTVEVTSVFDLTDKVGIQLWMDAIREAEALGMLMFDGMIDNPMGYPYYESLREAALLNLRVHPIAVIPFIPYFQQKGITMDCAMIRGAMFRHNRIAVGDDSVLGSALKRLPRGINKGLLNKGPSGDFNPLFMVPNTEVCAEHYLSVLQDVIDLGADYVESQIPTLS